MSWTSPFTVASTIRPLPPVSSAFSMCGSRYDTAVFMVSADWSTNGSCISPEANSSPTTFIPASSVLLTMSSAGVVASASSRSSSSPSRSPSMMRCSRRCSTGHPERSSFTAAVVVTFSNAARSSVSGS